MLCVGSSEPGMLSMDSDGFSVSFVVGTCPILLGINSRFPVVTLACLGSNIEDSQIQVVVPCSSTQSQN